MEMWYDKEPEDKTEAYTRTVKQNLQDSLLAQGPSDIIIGKPHLYNAQIWILTVETPGEDNFKDRTKIFAIPVSRYNEDPTQFMANINSHARSGWETNEQNEILITEQDEITPATEIMFNRYGDIIKIKG